MDIKNLVEWCNTNELSLNFNKCNIFTASRVAKSIHQIYKVNVHVIERKDTSRDLSVTLDRRFSFIKHNKIEVPLMDWVHQVSFH